MIRYSLRTLVDLNPRLLGCKPSALPSPWSSSPLWADHRAIWGGRGLIGGFVVTQVDDSLLADVIHDNRYLLSLHEYLLRYIKEGELIVGE